MSSETGPVRKPRRRISWINLSTIVSVIVLVGTEVFGVAYGGGWALANLLGIEELTTWLIALFCAAAAFAMLKLWKLCVQAEPVIRDAGDPVRESHD